MPMPPFDPNPEFPELGLSRIDDQQREPLQARLSRLEEPQRRTVLWLIAAEGLALSEYRLDETEGLRMLAFGVVEGPAPSLRVTVFLEPGHYYEGPGALQIEDERGVPERIPIGSEVWRLVPHQRVELLNATVCCWVTPHGGGEGLLTAAHAGPNGYCELDDGTVASLLWRAPGSLDAAVFNASAAGGLNPLALLQPLQEDSVEVITKAGEEERQIVAVSPTYGTTTSAIPHNFLLDRPLEEGDSGSLVRHRDEGDGLGLYIGALNTPEGTRGLCQGLFQLDSLFRFEGHCEGFYEE